MISLLLSLIGAALALLLGGLAVLCLIGIVVRVCMWVCSSPIRLLLLLMSLFAGYSYLTSLN